MRPSGNCPGLGRLGRLGSVSRAMALVTARAAPVNVPGRTYQVGDEVLTYYEEDCMWYPGRLKSNYQNGSYLVKWDVPEDGIEEIVVTASQMRAALIPVRKLQIGEKYSGIVFDVNSHGAFVDIGAEEHGLLPVSRMAVDWIDNPLDALQEGQQIDVWVSGKKDGHFSVSMVAELIESDFRPFLELTAEQWVEGTVKKILDSKAAFVTVFLSGASLDGLLHVSELSDAYVSSVNDVLSAGQKVQVRVLSIDANSGKMILSMKGAKSMVGRVTPALPLDHWVQGKVVRVMGFGAFVAVKPENADAVVEGLLHKSAILPGVSLTVGDVLDVRIDSVDLRRGKLKLSMLDAPKRAEHDERRRSRRTPRTTPEATQEFLREFQQVPADQLLLGCVTHITDAALFVTLRLETGTEADALLLPHHCVGMLELGQPVRVRIVELDVDNGKLRVSMLPAI